MTRLFLVFWLVCSVFATGAHAQGADSEAYQSAISDAVAEFSAGRWEEARSLFTEAHRIYPNARTLRGLGMAAFELRNYVEAMKMLRQALKSEVNPLTDDQRQKTEELLGRTRSFVGVYVVEGPDGMTLGVDGFPAAYDEEGRLLLNSGKHTLSPKFADGSTGTRFVDVRGGEEGTLVFEPSTSAGPSPAPPPAQVAELGEQPEAPAAEISVDTDGRSGRSVLPLVLMAAGGGLVGVGILTGIGAKNAEGDLEDACEERPTMCPIANRDTRDRAETLATVTNVLWIGGALVGALGVTLFLLDDGDEAPPVSASVGFSPDGAGLNLGGRF